MVKTWLAAAGSAVRVNAWLISIVAMVLSPQVSRAAESSPPPSKADAAVAAAQQRISLDCAKEQGIADYLDSIVAPDQVSKDAASTRSFQRATTLPAMQAATAHTALSLCQFKSAGAHLIEKFVELKIYDAGGRTIDTAANSAAWSVSPYTADDKIPQACVGALAAREYASAQFKALSDASIEEYLTVAIRSAHTFAACSTCQADQFLKVLAAGVAVRTVPRTAAARKRKKQASGAAR